MNVPAMSSDLSLPSRSSPDWRGWSVAICAGIGAGVPIGLGVAGLIGRIPGVFRGESIAWPILAGIAVGLLTASAARAHPVMKSLIAGVVVVGACLATLILGHWFTGHWAVGDVDQKWPFVAVMLLLYVCGPATLVGLAVVATRRRLEY